MSKSRKFDDLWLFREHLNGIKEKTHLKRSSLEPCFAALPKKKIPKKLHTETNGKKDKTNGFSREKASFLLYS